MKEELINKAYEIAKERYAAVGVDTEKVMETMQNFHLSLHCWQADDVTDGLRSTLGTAAAGTAPGVTASAPSAVFSAEVNTPSVASGNASAAKPVEEENSDTSYYDDLLAILNKRR